MTLICNIFLLYNDHLVHIFIKAQVSMRKIVSFEIFSLMVPKSIQKLPNLFFLKNTLIENYQLPVFQRHPELGRTRHWHLWRRVLDRRPTWGLHRRRLPRYLKILVKIDFLFLTRGSKGIK